MPARVRKLFLVDHCLTPAEHIPSAGILIENDRIIAVGGASAFMKEPGLEILDLTNCFAVPGFIDSHVHGAAGFDCSLAETYRPEEINTMADALASHGVTTFLPTIQAVPKERILKTVSALADMIELDTTGADPAGIHVEGPFLNPQKAGVPDPSSCVYPIDLKFAEELIAAGRGRIKLMTFAPELDQADQLITLLLENGVIPSMGHSLADEKSVFRAIDAGALRATHLFNAMPPLHQRENNLTLIALTDDRVSVEIIADGGHLHPHMIDLASRAKPVGKLIGISNALSLSGEGSSEIEPESGVIRQGGIIAGAAATLETGWMHLHSFTKMPATHSAACFSSNPAADLGLITRGELKPGKKADITFFDCGTNHVHMTVVRGKTVYQAGK